MEVATSITEHGVRKLCPECKKYFTAHIKQSGEIVGVCPNCQSKYFEQHHNKVRLIKTVRR